MTLEEVKTNIADLEKLIGQARQSISGAPNSAEAIHARMDLEHLEQTLSLLLMHREHLGSAQGGAAE